MHESAGNGQLVQPNRHAAVSDFSAFISPGFVLLPRRCRVPGLGKRRMLLLQRHQHEFFVLTDHKAACRRAHPSPRSIWSAATTRAAPSHWTLNGQGLSKPDKITLTNVVMFKPGDNVDKSMGTIWTQILLHQGGASLQQWFHKINFLDSSLQPPPSVLHLDCCAQVHSILKMLTLQPLRRCWREVSWSAPEPKASF